MPIYDPSDIEWYSQNQKLYEELADRNAKIIAELLSIKKINYAIIESRAKTVESFQKRLSEYGSHERNDLAGIRVVGYVKSDVDKIIEIINKNFIVDGDKSKDKSAELSPNQVGYRGIHLVCNMSKERIILPEYQKFDKLIIEIQIKTLLEHTWASINHDRNYKYKGLPEDLKRDLYLIAANLESADKQFNEITQKINEYVDTVTNKIDVGKLEELSIDSITLKNFFNEKFENNTNYDGTFGFDGSGATEIKELKLMNIQTIKELSSIIPDNLALIINEGRGENSFNLTLTVLASLLLKYGNDNQLIQTLVKTRSWNSKRISEVIKKYQLANEKINKK